MLALGDLWQTERRVFGVPDGFWLQVGAVSGANDRRRIRERQFLVLKALLTSQIVVF